MDSKLYPHLISLAGLVSLPGVLGSVPPSGPDADLAASPTAEYGCVLEFSEPLVIAYCVGVGGVCAPPVSCSVPGAVYPLLAGHPLMGEPWFCTERRLSVHFGVALRAVVVLTRSPVQPVVRVLPLRQIVSLDLYNNFNSSVPAAYPAGIIALVFMRLDSGTQVKVRFDVNGSPGLDYKHFQAVFGPGGAYAIGQPFFSIPPGSVLY